VDGLCEAWLDTVPEEGFEEEATVELLEPELCIVEEVDCFSPVAVAELWYVLEVPSSELGDAVELSSLFVDWEVDDILGEVVLDLFAMVEYAVE
jgi:hypothetical protein